MADWGKGASSKRRHTLPTEPKRVHWYDVTCVKCGMNYMIDCSPYSIPDAMSADGFICKVCRSVKLAKATPPPKSLQMRIEDTYGTKK